MCTNLSSGGKIRFKVRSNSVVLKGVVNKYDNELMCSTIPNRIHNMCPGWWERIFSVTDEINDFISIHANNEAEEKKHLIGIEK